MQPILSQVLSRVFHETGFLTFQPGSSRCAKGPKKYAALILAVEFEFQEKMKLSRFWKKVRILTSGNLSKFQKIDIFAFLCFLSEKSSPTSENLSPVKVFQVF